MTIDRSVKNEDKNLDQLLSIRPCRTPMRDAPTPVTCNLDPVS